MAKLQAIGLLVAIFTLAGVLHDASAADVAVCTADNTTGIPGTPVCDCVANDLGTTVKCASKKMSGNNVMTFPADTYRLGLTNTGLPRLSAVYLKLNDLLGLTELFVNDNTIDILAKDDLASLPNLLKFNVEMNLLKSVDRSSFTRTNKLTEINLKNNKLTVLLDSTFDDLASLKILKVSHNKLTGIAGGLFKKNAMLEVLDLAYNEFTTGISGLSSTSFQDGFGALKILRLNNNKLTSIMDTHFSKLLALDTLDLANNQLTLVADEAFNIPTAALAKLYLQNNKLASLSDKVIASIADINELYIEGTYWNCCLMGWAVNASNTKDLSSALCARPAIVKNKDLKNALAITVAKNACDQDGPTQPGQPRRLSQTSTSLKVDWTAVPGNAFSVDYYRVEYCHAVGGQCTKWETATCPTGELPPKPDAVGEYKLCSVLVSDEDIKNERQRFSINLVGLKKNAQYKTRVKAHTSLPGAAGDGGTWSQNGDPSALFRTNEDAPSKGSLPTLTSTSSRTIEAKWDKPSFPNGEITKYDVQYSEANVNATVWKTSVATAETYTLENLEPHTKYVVRIVPYTKIAPGPMSDTAEIQTKEDKPETPKNAPTVSKSRGALKSTSFVVEWNAVSAADANGVVLGYTVSVKQKTNRRRRAANGDIVYNKFVAGTGTTRDITGLTPATTYDVTVTARTAGGDSAASPPMYATTLDAAPEAPETPSLRAVTSKSILAQWRPPNVTNGEITGFAVSYKEYLATASNASNATLYATFNTSAFRLDALIEGLKPATEYVVHVRAFTALAASPQSTENRIATKDDQPSAVQCKATTVSSSRIDVSWAPPTTPNGAIQGYEVFVTSKVRVVSGYAPVQNMTDDLVLTTNANTLSARHDKLEPYTTYTYSVRARTSAGASTLDLMSSSKTLSALPAGQSPPTVRAIGATKAEIIWSKPKFPNGEITKYELHLTQEEGEVPTFSGIPAKQKDGKYTMNITGLEADTTYEFTLTSFTAIGPSVRSFRTVVRMGSTTPSAAVATLVATLCIFVIVLSLGFMWEHRTRTRRLRENSVEPDGNLKNPLSNGKQNMDAMFGTNQTAFRGNVPAANDDDSSSGSSFGTDSDDDDDESRA